MALRALALLLITLLGTRSTGARHLQYFGYHGGADTKSSLDRVRSYTNFAYVVARSDPRDPFVAQRVAAMGKVGLRALVEIGPVLWCAPERSGGTPELCRDWQARWATWKRATGAALSRKNVLGFAIFDEPFWNGLDMADFEMLCRKVKADFPWAKIIVVEAACAIVGQCGDQATSSFEDYSGSLPGVDWIGVDDYGIHPQSDPLYQDALARFFARFPDRRHVYVLDGFWDAGHREVAPTLDALGPISREWFAIAERDPQAVVLGVFSWGPYPPGTTTSRDMPVSVLRIHREIGLAITRRLAAGSSTSVGESPAAP